MERGEIAHELMEAAIAGRPFPSNVPDTLDTQELFARLKQELASLPPGVVPDVPWDGAPE